MPALVAVALLLQSALALPGSSNTRDSNPEALRALRAGLDTLYSGDFAGAASYFAELAARDTTNPAPLVFQAGAYIWWASAKDSADFELQRIDSLLGAALARARAAGKPGDFWLATALGYRARQREEHGHGYSAAKDAKAMRDMYRRLLAADSTCADCYLGLGVYDYGLARAGAFARFFARLIGLGGGNAERGIRYMRRAAHDGDLAQVEGTWVLAAALMREAARDSAGRAVLEQEARGYVEGLAARYPHNPVFQRFLQEVSPSGKTSAAETIGAPAGGAPAVIVPSPIGGRGAQGGQGGQGGRERGELAEHVVDVTLHGVCRDVEPLCDLFVAQSRRDQLFDLLLPLREPNRTGRGRDASSACKGANRLHDEGAVAVRDTGVEQHVAGHSVVFDDQHANARGWSGRRARATLAEANGPGHTPPPSSDVRYLAPGTSGSHRGSEV